MVKRPVPWFSSPEVGNKYRTSMPVGAMGTGLPGKSFTAAFTSTIDNSIHTSVELSVCSAVSTDTTTVSVLQARPSASTSGGPQQSFVGEYPVVLQSSAATEMPLHREHVNRELRWLSSTTGVNSTSGSSRSISPRTDSATQHLVPV